MADQTFDDVRALLADAAIEAPKFAPAPERTVRRARRRAATTVSLGVVTAVAAAAIAMPVFRTDREPMPAADRGFGRVVSMIPTGARPSSVAFPSSVALGDGSIWVVNTDEATLVRIDPSTEEVLARIELGVTRGGALHSFQFLQVAEGEGALWVLSVPDGELVRVDPATNAVVARIAVPFGTWMDAGAGAVWVTRFDGFVSRIDPATNEVVAEIRTGPRPFGIAAVDGAVWVADDFAGTLTRIDPASDQVVTTLRTGANLSGLVAADASGAWAIGCVPRDGSRDPRVDASACDWAAFYVDAGTGIMGSPILLPSPGADDPLGRMPFYVSAVAQGGVWMVPAYNLCMTECPKDLLLRLDPATGRTERMSVGEGITIIDVAPTPGELWAVANLWAVAKDDGVLIRIELQR